MSNPRKAKGTAFETAFVRWLQANGFPRAERRALHGTQDLGDVVNGPTGWTLELKNQQALRPSFVDEAEREATAAGTPMFAAVMKRRGKSDPGEALIVMPARVWIEWLKHAADRAA
jgi:hypothetical protein